jgi:hypothetical protein
MEIGSSHASSTGMGPSLAILPAPTTTRSSSQRRAGRTGHWVRLAKELEPAASAPGLARFTPGFATSARGLGSPLPHLHRDRRAAARAPDEHAQPRTQPGVSAQVGFGTMPLVSTGRRRRARDPAINKQRNGHAREHTNKRWCGLLGRGGRERTDERANNQANKASAAARARTGGPSRRNEANGEAERGNMETSQPNVR